MVNPYCEQSNDNGDFTTLQIIPKKAINEYNNVIERLTDTEVQCLCFSHAKGICRLFFNRCPSTPVSLTTTLFT